MIPIFKTCKAVSAVTALLGTNPMRLYEFSEAPQAITAPYAVWQVISGSPENQLSGYPNMDTYRIQLDIYGEKSADVRAVQYAILGAIELDAYVVSYNGEVTDKDTKLRRSSFDVNWLVSRS